MSCIFYGWALFFRDLCVFWIQLLYQKYVLLQILSYRLWLVITLLTVFFSQRKSLIWVMFSSLKNFSVFKNSLLNLWPSRPFLCFLLAIYNFVFYKFGFIIHFDLIFGKSLCFVSCFILFNIWLSHSSSIICWKDHPFYTELLWVFTKDQLTVFLWVYSGVYILFLWYTVLILSQTTCYLDCCSFLVKSWNAVVSSPTFLIQYCVRFSRSFRGKALSDGLRVRVKYYVN